MGETGSGRRSDGQGRAGRSGGSRFRPQPRDRRVPKRFVASIPPPSPDQSPRGRRECAHLRPSSAGIRIRPRGDHRTGRQIVPILQAIHETVSPSRGLRPGRRRLAPVGSHVRGGPWMTAPDRRCCSPRLARGCLTSTARTSRRESRGLRERSASPRSVSRGRSVRRWRPSRRSGRTRPRRRWAWGRSGHGSRGGRSDRME